MKLHCPKVPQFFCTRLLGRQGLGLLWSVLSKILITMKRELNTTDCGPMNSIYLCFEDDFIDQTVFLTFFNIFSLRRLSLWRWPLRPVSFMHRAPVTFSRCLVTEAPNKISSVSGYSAKAWIMDSGESISTGRYFFQSAAACLLQW